MGSEAVVLRCESVRQSDAERCPHPAKYLVPFDDRVVCGIHRRAFLRCIPLSDFDCGTPQIASSAEGDQ